TKGLRHAMGRALEAHMAPPPVKLLQGIPLRAEDSPTVARHKGCIHCHNVNEFRRADAKAAGTWDRNSIWVYPPPENVGLALEIHIGNRVKAVAAGSPAAGVGLQPGDFIETITGYRISSQGDVMFALHKSPAKGTIAVEWRRGGKRHSGALEVADGWRKTDLTWRPSMHDNLPSPPVRGDDPTPPRNRPPARPAGQAA